MIPNDDSYCEIDPQNKDQYGIPTLRFHWKWSRAREAPGAPFAQDLYRSHRERWAATSPARQDLLPGGFIIHEVGGAIMGSDPKNSVVNQWGQSWDVKNLFITDGAPFPSNADKNPTLTIMALAWRAPDYMLAAMKRKEL